MTILRRPPGRSGLALPMLVTLALAGVGCGASDAAEAAGDPPAAAAPDSALAATLRRATALADSVEDLLRPVPLMRPAQEDALRRYPNAEHVRTARRLGVRPDDEAALDALVEEGRLVVLEDSTDVWVLREMGASRPLVTPDARALLEEIGRRFQARLAEMGLPPLRYEVSSALRTAASQAALRRSNANAAAGTSSHEFGTTVDIPYSGYAAPVELPGLVAGQPAAELDRVARAILERMIARKSRELQAILGDVMLELQADGAVLVTLERQQPVYHITVNDAG